MKRIWIRKSIPTYIKIIMGIIFIIILLSLWIFVTTIKSPRQKISITDFEEIIKKINFQSDKEKLLANYTRDDAQKIYLLKNKQLNKDKIELVEILKSSGYYKTDFPNPIFSPNVLPHPLDILKSFPRLVLGINESNSNFQFNQSLLFAVWVSLRRELISFLIVIIFAIPIGVLMSCNNHIRGFIYPLLIVGSFIPIAALIPLTLAFFGIGEEQKIIFLCLSMFFVMLGLIMKEIDEVDDILLNTAYTLGFNQIQTIIYVLLPTALPRIWKHFASIFGLGWGYIIFAEMINTGGEDAINGIGWLFIARQRRFKVDEMYAIFFIIIIFAFIFSYLFKLSSYILFKYERGLKND